MIKRTHGGSSENDASDVPIYGPSKDLAENWKRLLCLQPMNDAPQTDALLASFTFHRTMIGIKASDY